MRKLAAGLAVVTATALPVVALSPAPGVQAAPLCQSVNAWGTIVGTWVAGPYCTPYGGATICEVQSAGFEPYANATVKVCVPAPLVAGHGGSDAGQS